MTVTPLISEFLASNNNGLRDEDGDRSDWIELYNPSLASLSLDGYYLTDNDGDLTQWRFPDVTIPAGGYLVVFADGKDRSTAGQELHTNFSLSSDGGYLALVGPDGSTILSQYAPQYPQQLADTSYGLSVDTTRTSLISAGGSAQVYVPANGLLGLGWTSPSFVPDATWITGTSGVGYDVVTPPPRVSGFSVRMIDTDAGDIYDIGVAQTLLNGTAPQGSFSIAYNGSADYATVNVGNGGDFYPDLRLPNGAPIEDSGAPGREQYAIRATSDVFIPAGTWTIDVGSDDGFMLKIPGVTFTNRNNEEFSGASNPSAPDTLVFGSPRGHDHTFATFTVPAGGLNTTLTLDFYERWGGDDVELSIASGWQTSFSASSFSLLSDGLRGWSVKTTSSSPPPNYTSLIKTDLLSQMRGRNASAYIRMPFSVADPDAFDSLRLSVKYDDGFVAYLNGHEIARRNAPDAVTWNSAATADHATADALVYEDIDLVLPEGLLRSGANVLAIQGLNDGKNSSNFLVAAELQGMRTLSSGQRYFKTPTPGAANSTGEQISIVRDTKFSHNRGFYDAPFMLTITTETAGATIRYTTDGTAPTASNGQVYTSPIPITSTTTIRAAAFKAGALSSDIDTHTYIFLNDVLTQSANGQAPSGWPQSLSGQVLDYGMDPDVVNRPTFSNVVVIGSYAYFAASNGINASNNGYELWKTDGTASGTVMVKDINGSAGSMPMWLTNVNGTLFFQADNGGNGCELWKSDGTSAGTVMVKDINSGGGSSYPSNLTAIGSTLYFTAYEPNYGYELWKSDGTSSGTVRVQDINPGGSSSDPKCLVTVNGKLFFAANDGTSGTELWVSDGTAGGTVRLKDINAGVADSNPSWLVNVNNTLYFVANDGRSGTELWKSNGSAVGTVRVADINPGAADSNPLYLTGVGNTLYFAATDGAGGTELWRSNGTAGSTYLVKDINPGINSSIPNSLVNAGGTLYFTAYDPGTGFELWKSDGSSAGTTLVSDIRSGTGSSGPANLTNLNGTLVFTANDGTSGVELWRSDGTAAGTLRLADIVPGSGDASPCNLATLNGSLIFAAAKMNGNCEIWKSDATESGTRLLKLIWGGSAASSPTNLSAVGDSVYFQANDGSSGAELWWTDGTAPGTMMLRDINYGSTGSSPANFTDVNGTVFFTARDATTGIELWKWDRTAGAVLVKDINAGIANSSPNFLTNVNGTLFFVATTSSNGVELWKSDGTAAGTVMVRDINAGSSGSAAANLTHVNGTLYFSAKSSAGGIELWKSNGTASGTVRVRDINPSGDSSPASFVNIGGTLYFAASNGTNGRELWKSDGTPEGTVLVKDIYAGSASSAPSNLTNVGDVLYFTATDPESGAELWKSDGTPEGTVLVRDINPGVADSSPYGLVDLNGTVLFGATSDGHGAEVWRSDGTAAGTYLVRDIQPGVESSDPVSFTRVNGAVYFVATDLLYGTELWKTDGTAAGTGLVMDISVGSGSSSPTSLVNANGALFFAAHDGVYGRELWTSDGTAAGTGLIRPIGAANIQRLTSGDMESIPTISIVMDPKDLFDANTGIYSHPSDDGRNWERLASIELLRPDGTEGFQINGGIRIRGGFSRDGNNPKHALRLFFRDDPGYGGKLEYPMFGDDGADEFEKFDLRCAQNYSWSYQNDSRHIAIRDQFNRDTQGAMGQPTAHGDFYHLYINGQYWGLYNTDERPSASNAAELYGGSEDEYDVIKVDPDLGYNIEATEGDMLAWTNMWNQVTGDMTSVTNYMRVQGKNPDGTRNPEYEELLDVDNLIDYMLIIFYGGNLDAPLSWFLGNSNPNNFYAIRSRNGTSGGFKFYVHDAEHTLLDVNEDRTGPFNTISADPATALNKSNPQYIFQLLSANPEFRLRVADRIHQHFFNGGALTPAASIDRFMRLKNEIDRAVVAESARWGDSKRATPLTRNADWVVEINRILSTYLPQRSSVVLNQLKADNLYSSVAAPEYDQFGGDISAGFQLSISNPGGAGTVYYTLDGTDPRVLGGAVAPTALAYGSPVPLNHSAKVMARVLYNGTWSALTEATFTSNASALRVTELMYNPPVPPAGSPYIAQDFEYIELQNTSAGVLNLGGLRFAEGIDFAFPDIALAPGQRVLIVKNQAAFESRYGTGRPIIGTFADDTSLSDGGERIAIVGAAGEAVLDFSYKDGWYPITDGGGYSLVAVDPKADASTYGDKANWRPSNRAGGAPGQADPGLPPNAVVINEVLASTDTAAGQWVELYNTTGSDIDLGGWFLSNDKEDLARYAIPAGTIIPAHGYLVLSQAEHFGSAFTIDSLAESYVYLSSSDGMGNPGGYRESAHLWPADEGITLGRFTKGTGAVDFSPLSAPTLGMANATPLTGPVVISEMMYNPAAGGNEFIELKNLTGAAIPLHDALTGAGWMFTSGVTFSFPAGAQIPAFGYVLVVSIDPATFADRYAVPSGVPIFGPYTGSLANNGELVELSRPGTPLNGTVPYILVDRVNYSNSDPWPTAPDGSGASLARVAASAYGNDATNWTAGPFGGTPGVANGQEPPSVDIGLDAIISQGDTFTRMAMFSDPNASQTWTAMVNWGDGGLTQPLNLNAKNFTLSHPYSVPGTYTITVTVTDSLGGIGSDSLTLTVLPDSREGTAGNDTYTLRLDPTGTYLQFFENVPVTGQPSFYVLRSALGALSINGNGGDDALIIDLANGNPVPAAGITFAGGSGLDLLQVIGSNGNDAITAGGSSVRIGGGTITYTAAERVEIHGGAGDDTLAITAQAAVAPTFIGGAGNDTLSVEAGTYELTAATAAGTTRLNLAASGSAIVNLTASQNLASLSVTGTARVNLAAGGSRMLRTSALTIGPEAALDLTDNDLILTHADSDHGAAKTQGLIDLVLATLANNWEGTGITSSVAKVSEVPTTLAVFNNDYFHDGQAIFSDFGGVAVDQNCILVKYTYFGDLNLDGEVTGDDYALIDMAYQMGTTSPGWLDGDITYDGAITGDDYALMDVAWQTQSQPLASGVTNAASVFATQVIEPDDWPWVNEAAGALSLQQDDDVLLSGGLDDVLA